MVLNMLQALNSQERISALQLNSGRHTSLNGSWTNLLFIIITSGLFLCDSRRGVGTSISSRYSKLALINTQTMMYGIQNGMVSVRLLFKTETLRILNGCLLTGPANRT